MDRITTHETGERDTGIRIHPVVIIGAGLNGLAAAYDIRKTGIEPVILEKPDMHQSMYFTILENDYLITEAGYEQLTTTPEEIRIIP